jgi:hypothetical protein
MGDANTHQPFLVTSEYGAGSKSFTETERASWYAGEWDSLRMAYFPFALHYTLADYWEGTRWVTYGMIYCNGTHAQCGDGDLNSYWVTHEPTWENYKTWRGTEK